MKFYTLFVVVVLNLIVSPASAMPSIFHSTETAGPGDVISLQGDNFGSAPQVWMQHVVGTEPSLSSQVQLPILTSNTIPPQVTSRIPTTETAGLYAIWVKDGANLSAPVYINQARAWGANDLCGTVIDPSRSFRLFGRNLCPAGSSPSVRFVNGVTSLAATVTTTGSDTYGLKVTAPSGLVAGTIYTVKVKNGFGGTYGETSLCYNLTARAGASDPFGLNVPWASDFATIATNVYNVKTDSRLSLHAVGDGVTNDTAAIQAAIYAAYNAGGGVVYCPTGTYLLHIPTGGNSTALTLASNVVLKGDGMNSTQLKLTGFNPHSYGFTIDTYSCSRVGFYNLCFYNTTTGTETGHLVANSSEVFASGVKFITDIYYNLNWQNNTNVLIQNCVINNTQVDTSVDNIAAPLQLGPNTDVIFRNNTVTYYFARVIINGSIRALVESNHITRNAINNGTLCESGGFDIGQDDSLVLLNNTLDKGGTGNVTYNGGDGETILSQYMGDQSAYPGSPYNGAVYTSFGTATGSSGSTLVDSTSPWTYDYNKPIWGQQGAYVAIVSGPGTGQIRKIVSNTTSTLNITPNWTVNPTSASRYAVNAVGSIHNIIEGNSLSQNPVGIDFYAVSLLDVAVANNTIVDNGGIYVYCDDFFPDVWTTSKNFQTAMDTVVTGNSINDSNNLYSGCWANVYATAGFDDTSEAFGTSLFGVEFRRNTLTTPVTPPSGMSSSIIFGEGFSVSVQNEASPYQSNSTVGATGTIFQANTTINAPYAYTLDTGDYSTAIWDSTLTNVPSMLLDLQAYGTTHASVNTVTSDLVARWKLDETTGPAHDSSVNGLTGAWYNNPTFSATHASPITYSDPGCLTFDGATQYIDMGNPAVLPSGRAPRTLCAWAKSYGAPGYGWIASFGSPTGDAAMFIGTYGTSLVGGGYWDDLSYPNFWDGNWHFIALTYDGTTAKLYADGTLVASAAKNWNLVQSTCFIGKQVNTSENWNGSIDDVRIYSRALSATEIANLAAGNQ